MLYLPTTQNLCYLKLYIGRCLTYALHFYNKPLILNNIFCQLCFFLTLVYIYLFVTHLYNKILIYENLLKTYLDLRNTTLGPFYIIFIQNF